MGFMRATGGQDRLYRPEYNQDVCKLLSFMVLHEQLGTSFSTWTQIRERNSCSFAPVKFTANILEETIMSEGSAQTKLPYHYLGLNSLLYSD